MSSLTSQLHSSVETRKKLEALVAQLTHDLEKAREVKVQIEDISGKMGKMLLGPALGFGDRQGIGYDGASTSQISPGPVLEFTITPYGHRQKPRRRVRPRKENQGPPLIVLFCTY